MGSVTLHDQSSEDNHSTWQPQAAGHTRQLLGSFLDEMLRGLLERPHVFRARIIEISPEPGGWSETERTGREAGGGVLDPVIPNPPTNREERATYRGPDVGRRRSTRNTSVRGRQDGTDSMCPTVTVLESPRLPPPRVALRVR